jgi:hypothetical protein
MQVLLDLIFFFTFVQKLSANLDMAMTRANRANEMETDLASAQQANLTLQNALW